MKSFCSFMSTAAKHFVALPVLTVGAIFQTVKFFAQQLEVDEDTTNSDPYCPTNFTNVTKYSNHTDVPSNHTGVPRAEIFMNDTFPPIATVLFGAFITYQVIASIRARYDKPAMLKSFKKANSFVVDAATIPALIRSTITACGAKTTPVSAITLHSLFSSATIVLNILRHCRSKTNDKTRFGRVKDEMSEAAMTACLIGLIFRFYANFPANLDVSPQDGDGILLSISAVLTTMHRLANYHLHNKHKDSSCQIIFQSIPLMIATLTYGIYLWVIENAVTGNLCTNFQDNLASFFAIPILCTLIGVVVPTIIEACNARKTPCCTRRDPSPVLFEDLEAGNDDRSNASFQSLEVQLSTQSVVPRSTNGNHNDSTFSPNGHHNDSTSSLEAQPSYGSINSQN